MPEWKKLTNSLKRLDVISLFLLSILAIITFYPLFFGGFDNHDDVYFAINTWTSQVPDTITQAASGQGRVHLIWGILLFITPYIFDNLFWYLFFKFGSFFLLLGALYYSTLKIFRSPQISLITTTFFLAIVQNGQGYGTLTSFPFVFNFYATLFLISIGLFITALEQERLNTAFLAGLLYFFAIGSELFVLFFPLYLILFLSIVKGKSLKEQVSVKSKYLLAIAIPLIIYLITYFAWRQLHPSNYDGNVIQCFNFIMAIKVIVIYSLTALPLASLHLYPAAGNPIPFKSLADLQTIFSELSPTLIIKPIIVGFLFIRLLTIKNYIEVKNKILITGMFLSGIGIFLPNLLISLTLKYQDWLNNGVYSYVYTYYSFISAVVFLALLLIYLDKKSHSWRRYLRLLLMTTIIGVIMFISLAVEIRNQYLAFDQKLAQRKWQLMDVMIKSPIFNKISNGSTIIAPTLLLPKQDLVPVFAYDWSNYVKYRTGKNIEFTEAECKKNTECYNLIFRQDISSDNQFFILQKIGEFNSLSFNKLTIYSLPSRKNTTVIGSFTTQDFLPKIKVNDSPVTNIKETVFSATFPNNSKRRLFETATLIGNVKFIPEQITISHYDIEL